MLPRHSTRSGVILIILLAFFAVAFFIAAFFAYRSAGELTEARKVAEDTKVARDKETEKISALKETIDNVSKQVGYQMEVGGTPSPDWIATDVEGRSRMAMSYPRLAEKYGSVDAIRRDPTPVRDPKTGKNVMVNGVPFKVMIRKEEGEAQDVYLTQQTARTLQDVIADQDRLINELHESLLMVNSQLDEVLTELALTRDQSEKAVKETRTNFEAKLQEKENQIKDAQDKFTEVQSELDKKDGDIIAAIKRPLDEQITQKDQQINELTLKLREEEKKYNKMVKEVAHVKLSLRGYLGRRDEPDGTVAQSDRDNDLVYIDVGSEDGLQVGTQFTVFKPLAGGNRMEKGTIRVQRIISNHFSQCAVISKEEGAEAIYENDLVISPIFQRGLHRYFAFAGEFGGVKTKYSREHLRARLQEAGAIVQDIVDTKTEILILGQEYTEDKNYKIASELKTDVMTEDQLHRYLDYTK
ncbi:MAG: hypothetical protein HY719_00475 [Planctomycetes bacterium]|nr:hypothetical protein [Planctomycetota bacterium]